MLLLMLPYFFNNILLLYNKILNTLKHFFFLKTDLSFCNWHKTLMNKAWAALEVWHSKKRLWGLIFIHLQTFCTEHQQGWVSDKSVWDCSKTRLFHNTFLVFVLSSCSLVFHWNSKMLPFNVSINPLDGPTLSRLLHSCEFSRANPTWQPKLLGIFCQFVPAR